jgi:AcrR family transcriptional regulator
VLGERFRRDRFPAFPMIISERTSLRQHRLENETVMRNTIRDVPYSEAAAPRSAEGARRSGRPRNDEREGEILEAVAALLAERGYEGVTFEEVARRAGASKATLYRRWSSRREMVVAAVKAGPAARPPGPAEIDTGSLRGDLLALCQRLIATMRSTDGRTALLLLQVGLEDPELCEEIERAVGPTGARLPPAVVDAAIRRGELPEGVDPFAFEEVAGAVLLLRRLNGLETDDAYLEALVDAILIPALRATRRAPRGLPAGIFSGRPASQSTADL